MTATLEAPSETLELLAPGESIPDAAQSRPSVWDKFRAEVERLKATADTLSVVSVDDRAGMALARQTRLAIRQIRLAIEARHKEEKAFYLEGGRKVDASKNTLLALTDPLEDRMLALETFAEREALRIEDEQRAARTAELQPYLDGPVAVDLGKMDAATYATMLDNARSLHELKLERIRKAEEDRIAKEQADAAERERMRAENERLKAEAVQREKEAQVERERVEAERKAERGAAAERERAAEAERQKEREANEAALKKEREEAAERQREADAKAKAERDAADKLARETQAKLAAEKAEADQRAAALEKQEADRKAAEAAKVKADALAAKKAAAAPDVQKLLTYATDITGMAMPRLANASAAVVLAELRGEFITRIKDLAAKAEGGLLL